MKIASIVLPTYNEAGNLPLLLPRLFGLAAQIRSHELHIVVADDNSPDGTAEIVRLYQEAFSTLHLITGPKQGLGEAYKRGLAYAIQELNADLLLQMDADLQHDPRLIPEMVRLCAQHENTIVVASRFTDGAATPDFSLRRRLLSRAANKLARFCGGLPPVTDCTSGYRCFPASLAKECDFRRLATRGYCFQTALLYELICRGGAIVEIPQIFGRRGSGNSKLGLRDCLEFMQLLAALAWRRIAPSAPAAAPLAKSSGAGSASAA